MPSLETGALRGHFRLPFSLVTCYSSLVTSIIARRCCFLLFLIFPGAFLPSLVAAESVQWYSSLEEASAAARQANQPMMLDFWADWCAACKVMQTEVYSNSDFQEATQRFLPVRIDFDKKPAIARKYNIVALPTIVFTDSYGTELFRYRGYIDAKVLAELLRALPADVSEFNRLNRILAEDKNNFEALESMGKKLRISELFLASNEYYAKALQNRAAKADPQKKAPIMAEMALNFLEVKEAKKAAETFEKCLKEFPDSQNRLEWMLGLAQAYSLGGKKDQARQVLDALVRESPGSTESQKAKTLLGSL